MLLEPPRILILKGPRRSAGSFLVRRCEVGMLLPDNGEVFVNMVDLTGKSWNRLLPWVQESAERMRGLWDAKNGMLAA